MADADPLVELSEAVADGKVIDWERYRDQSPHDQSTVEHLRLIAAIAAVTRTADTSPPTTADAAGRAAHVKGKHWGPLVIVDTIGEGAFGRVYRAHDPRLQRDVALKVLGPRGHRTTDGVLVSEARLLARLRHPNVVTVYGADEIDGEVGLWMELIEGQTTLSSWVTAHGPLGAEEAAIIGATLCRAVAAVHQAGLLHRDIKAQNVMREPGGRIVLMDFGAGRDVLDDSGRSVIGTPVYLAPEVLAGEAASVRSDLYSLGVLLFFMTTRQYPVEASTLSQLRVRHQQAGQRHLRDLRADLPADFVDVVCRALDPNPARRFDSAGQLEQALRAVAGKGDSTTDVSPALPTTTTDVIGRTTSSRRRWATIAGVLIGVGALLAAAALVPRWLAEPAPLPHLVAIPCTGPTSAGDATMVCNGFLEDAVRRLSRLSLTHPIQVTTLGESQRRGIPTVDASRALIGATIALTGVVNQAGEHREIELRLTATNDPTIRRAGDAFSLPVADLFTGQDRTMAWVARQLGLELDHTARNRLTSPHTTSLPAFDAYASALGTFFAERRSRASLDEVLRSLATATAADSGFARAHALTGFAALAQFELTKESRFADEAIAACDRAVALEAKLPESHACRGQVLHVIGRHREAAAAMETAVYLDGSYDDAIVWLGREHEDERNFEAAEEVYRDAVAKRPRYWATHAWLGNYFRRQARYEETADVFEAVTRLIPDASRPYVVLAAPLMYVGRYDAALRAIERSIALEPTTDAYINWSMTLYRMRRFDEADRMVDRALAMASPTHQLIASAARIKYYGGHRDQADALYAEAIRMARDTLQSPGRKSDLLVGLAEYSVKRGLKLEAARYLQESGIDRNSPVRPIDPHVLFNVAMVYNQLGDRAEALAWLERAVYWGVPPAELLAFPELDDLRDDAGFRALLRHRNKET